MTEAGGVWLHEGVCSAVSIILLMFLPKRVHALNLLYYY